MTSAKEIFLIARELTNRGERAAYLNRACVGDVDLQRQVEALLRTAEGADAYFGATDGLLGAPPPGRGASEGPGTVIGRYVLEERIGEGGMGMVYRARQLEPVVRQVALKVIRWGMDTHRVVARFEAERQTLALMDHPNIARVLDAGSTDTGRPYFVMELVAGLPITSYCDRRRLSLRQRLELFVQVCQAVQHAHQKGIIHRDLKPSNVLVAEVESGDGERSALPKVIDFGVAKAIHGTDGAGTHTTTWAGLLGTPAYMSPEQADPSSSDIDTRTDIYSLGVLLYELLAGATPFETRELTRMGLNEVVRTLRDTEASRPSVRVARLGSETLGVIAAARGLSGAQLEAELRGDLDCVAMKCLEKDRARRYATVNGLARDLQRHLNDERVEARPASVRDQLMKLTRRHRAAVGATAAIGLALFIATFVSVSWGVRASRAERAQSQLRQQAEALSDDLRRELYFSRMNQAEVFWDQREIDRLRQLLVETSQSPHRGFEWNYWMRMAHLEAVTYRGHVGSISAVAWSPDGRHAVSGDGSPSLQWWEAETGRKLREFPGIREPVKCVAVTPDGRAVLSGGLGGLIRVHAVDSGEERQSFRAHEGGVSTFALASDGRTLVSGGWDHQVKVWDLAAAGGGRVLATFGGGVTSVAVSADGRRFVAASYDRRTVLGDVEGTPVRALEQADAVSEICFGVAFSPEADRVAAGNKAGWIHVWDAADGRLLWSAHGHGDAVHTLTYGADGRRLFSTGADRVIAVWDAEQGQALGSLRGHSAGVNALVLSADGRRMVTGASDSTVKVWEVPAGSLAESGAFEMFHGHCDWLQGIRFFPDGRHLLTYVNGAWIWDLDGPRETHAVTIEGHRHMIFAAAIAPDGQRVVTGGDDRTLRVWSAADGTELARQEDLGGIVRALAVFPDNRRFVAGGDDGMARIHELATARATVPLGQHAKAVRCVAVSRDGRWVATWGEGGSVRLWDGATGQRQREIEVGTAVVVSLDFSPRDSRLLLGIHSPENRLRVVDPPTGTTVYEKRLGPQGLHAALYSPDGRRVLLVNESPTGELLDADTGRELLSLRGGTELHRAGAFSPDGRRIALGTLAFGRDHLVRIWKSASPEEAEAWLAEDRQWLGE